MTEFGHYEWIWIVAFVAIIAFALYRRGRRLIGRQRVNPRRMTIRTVIIAIATIYLLVIYARRGHPALVYESAAAGFVLGAIIAAFALRFTRMGRDERGVWYIPNLYLGLGLIALLIARFAYEYIVIFPRIREQATAAAATGADHIALTPQPMLHGVLFLVLGYYLIYYGTTLIRNRRLEAEPPTDNSAEP